MSCAMTRDEAVRLHGILDEKIGFFRVEDMSPRALEFYNEKTDEFINQYSTELPEEYWFQGFKSSSVNLVFDSVNGLRVVCPNGDKTVQQQLDEEVNPYLKDIVHTSIFEN